MPRTLWKVATLTVALVATFAVLGYLVVAALGPSPDRMAAAAYDWPAIETLDARCGDPTPEPLTDPRKIAVTLPPAKPFTLGKIPAKLWRDTPVKDVTWQLKFLSLSWMRPLAARAHAENRSDVLAALVAQTAAFHQQNPDTGRQAEGWDEGSAMRRLQTENCLYALTRAPELVPGMVADAKVQLGDRYYGPPLFAVHNHGLMANLQLVRAADLLQRTEWKDTALRRLAEEAPKPFSPMGTSLEQSSQYQQVNADQWAQAARLLNDSEESRRTAAQIRATVDLAYRMLNWMTEPDGNLVQIGDADRREGRPTTLTNARSVRDDVAGFLAGRWSWTDPQTGYYTVRYGPARRAHGHHDQAGAVTFSTLGVRVLVGAGRHSYNKEDPFRTYQLTPQAENMAVPDPVVPVPTPPADGSPPTSAPPASPPPTAKPALASPAIVSSSTFMPQRHIVTVRDTMFADPHGRTIDVEPRSMTVSDTYQNATTWKQSWHLDPKWKLVSRSGTELVFTHAAGRKLTITTTGRVTDVQRGVTGATTAGWHFPVAGKKQAAYQITVTNNGRQCATTFTVTNG